MHTFALHSSDLIKFFGMENDEQIFHTENMEVNEYQLTVAYPNKSVVQQLHCYIQSLSFHEGDDQKHCWVA